MATKDTAGMKVVDNTDRFRAADADKKVFDPEHASGVVLLNGVIVVSPDERAPVGAVARSIGLVEYEVDEHPAPLPEGGPDLEGDVKQPTGRAPDHAVDDVAAPKTGTSGAGKKP